MDEETLRLALKKLGLPAIRYYPTVGSTNDIALEWAAEGAAEFSLVVAESQSSGRGRLNRRWFTKPGEGLAFSVILRPKPKERIPLFSPMGGVAVCDSIIRNYHLPAMIKWPNDVLVQDKKVCGILAETQWESSPSVVLGIGVDVGKESLPPAGQIHFPATSLETETGHSMDRIEVLTGILNCLIEWRNSFETPEFYNFWKEHLAFVQKPVQVISLTQTIHGILKGISEEGNLQIQQDDGTTIYVEMGDVQLRPIS